MLYRYRHPLLQLISRRGANRDAGYRQRHHRNAGFGGTIVSKVKPLRGVLLVFAVWILYVLVKTGIAAAMS